MRITLLASALFIAVSASLAAAATTSCSTVAACLMGTNTSAGYGVEGTSKANDGVVGITTQASTSTSNGRAGIAGYDNSTNKGRYNSGVYGVSTYGTGVNAKGGTYGVAGTATGSGTGVYGSSTSGPGVYGSSSSGPGLRGYSSSGYGGIFSSLGSSSLDLDPERWAPPAYFSSGYGALVLFGTVQDGGNSGPSDLLFSVVGCWEAHNNPNSECAPSYQLYADGGMSASAITTRQLYIRTKRSVGSDVASYSARSASPTLEDFGRSTLRSGAAYVALDPVFASTIDTRSYMVFITPEGESRGLYTTQLAANGFEVKENASGRSSISFSYRIVAHPIDTGGAAGGHLPLMSSKMPVPRSARKQPQS